MKLSLNTSPLAKTHFGDAVAFSLLPPTVPLGFSASWLRLRISTRAGRGITGLEFTVERDEFGVPVSPFLSRQSFEPDEIFGPEGISPYLTRGMFPHFRIAANSRVAGTSILIYGLEGPVAFALHYVPDPVFGISLSYAGLPLEIIAGPGLPTSRQVTPRMKLYGCAYGPVQATGDAGETVRTLRLQASLAIKEQTKLYADLGQYCTELMENKLVPQFCVWGPLLERTRVLSSIIGALPDEYRTTVEPLNKQRKSLEQTGNVLRMQLVDVIYTKETQLLDEVLTSLQNLRDLELHVFDALANGAGS